MRSPDPLFAEAVLRDGLRTFPFVEVTVTGSCMAPDLREGDCVRLVGAARQGPRAGQIVLVKHVAGLRLHRLVWGPPFASSRGPWRTRADRAGGLDAAVKPSDVLATAVEVEGRALPSRRLGPTLKAAWRSLRARIRRRPRAIIDT
jgi:hypothetical protein